MAASGITPSSPIGYYVHHHGTGHMQRAVSIVSRMSRPVIMFSSLDQPAGLPPRVCYIQLPEDVVDAHVQAPDSVFHYTPYDTKIFDRYQVLIDAWRAYGIQELYVDVSIEVAVLAKLYGLRVGHAAMPGHRTDTAHRYGYQAVDYLMAHYTPEFDTPNGRNTTTPTYYSGGISRFTKRSFRQSDEIRDVVITMSPSSHNDVISNIRQVANHFSDITWHTVGFEFPKPPGNVISHGIVDDPFLVYTKADVIIGGAGTNTIMETASLSIPFICIPEERPYDEQIAAASTLEKLQAAIYLRNWPSEPKDWQAVFSAVRQIDMKAFQHLVDDNAAQNAVDIIESAGTLHSEDYVVKS